MFPRYIPIVVTILLICVLLWCYSLSCCCFLLWIFLSSLTTTAVLLLQMLFTRVLAAAEAAKATAAAILSPHFINCFHIQSDFVWIIISSLKSFHWWVYPKSCPILHLSTKYYQSSYIYTFKWYVSCESILIGFLTLPAMIIIFKMCCLIICLYKLNKEIKTC